MNTEIIAQIEQRFATCTTHKEVLEVQASILETNPLICEARALRNSISTFKSNKEKELRAAERAPFEDEAKSFRKGQKVYFAKSCKSVAIGWDLRRIKGSEKKIEAGDWCYVWEYQPKARQLWLCQPRKACKYENVIRSSFSISEMMHHGIRKTELNLRK